MTGWKPNYGQLNIVGAQNSYIETAKFDESPGKVKINDQNGDGWNQIDKLYNGLDSGFDVFNFAKPQKK